LIPMRYVERGILTHIASDASTAFQFGVKPSNEVISLRMGEARPRSMK